MINVGILTNFNDDLLPFLLKKIYNLQNINFYLIVAKTKNDNSKSLKIFKERTGEFFLKKELNLFNSNFQIPSYLVNSHNSKDFYKIIKSNNIKFLYNSGTLNKITKKTLKIVKGVINIHPGILPYYRGCTCPEWTLFNNDILGITSHFMDEGYDSGPIIKIKYLKFKEKNIKDYKDLRIRFFLSSFKLAREIFKNIDKIKSYPQDKSKAKYYPVIKESFLKKIKQKLKKNTYKFNKKNLLV